MKKALALLLALVMVLALCACGGSGGAQTASGGGSTSDARLTARQQRELDEWNAAYPSMKMTAKEFLNR